MPKISVIVPVYKVQEYLPECVDSLLTQTFTDFEIILVDDGSPDKCGLICDEYAEKDLRVKVIHQENIGLSGARNKGLDIANGKYVTFIDSDDCVSQIYLETLYNGLISNDSDVAICQYQHFKKSDTIVADDNISISTCSGKKAVLSVYENSVPIIACGKLFKKDLFHANKFPEGRIHEDQAIIPLVLYCCSQVTLIRNKLYYFRIRRDSITHTSFTIARYDDLVAIDNCIDFYRQQKEYEIIKSAERARKIMMCCYAIEAIQSGIFDSVPQEYKINKLTSLIYLMNHLSDDKFIYYLNKVYPKLAVIFEYKKKLKSHFNIFNREKEK